MVGKERDEHHTERIHIIGEDDKDLILAVRVEKAALTANFSFLLALFELGHLLLPET
jgi:hypothetical protein